MTDAGLSRIRLLHAAFGLGAAAAVMVAIAGLLPLAEGPARRAPVALTARVDVEPVIAAIALVALAAIAAGALVPRPWARPMGVLATNAVAVGALIEVMRGRVDGVFAPDVRTTLLAGGVLLVVAFALAIVAVVAQLLALRQIAQARPVESPDVLDAVAMRSDGQPLHSPPEGRMAVVLGLAGLIAPFVSGAAAAFGIAALGEIRAYDGRLGGRTAAIGGLVLGIVGLSVVVTAMVVGLAVLTPGS